MSPAPYASTTAALTYRLVRPGRSRSVAAACRQPAAALVGELPIGQTGRMADATTWLPRAA